MEDTDQIIITTFKQLGYQAEIPPISKMTGDDVRAVTLFFLQLFQVDTKPLESTEGAQRYRIAQKIVDALKKSMGVQTDFMLLINPNPADVRKFLIAMISKFSNLGDEKPAESAMSFEEVLDFERNNNTKSVLKSWVSDEWIIPDLKDESINQSRHFYFSFDENTLKTKSLHELIPDRLSQIKQALFNQISSHFVKTNQGKEVFTVQTSYLRGKDEESRAIKEGFLSKNRVLWETIKRENERARHLTAAVKEEKREIEQVQLQLQQEETSQYALELSYKQEDPVPASISIDSPSKEVNFEQDIEAIKEKHRRELDELNVVLDSHKDEFSQLTDNLRALDERRLQTEEALENDKIRSSEIQKSTEGLHEILGYLQDPKASQKELEDQCSSLNREMKEMQDEWESHKTKVMSKIENFKQKMTENKEKVEEIQSKITFMENDYDGLIGKIKGNQQLRANLQNEYMKMPKELTRNYFVKRINDVNANFKKQKNDLGKILQEVKDIERTVDGTLSLMEKTNTEIENILRADSKPDTPTKAIFKLFAEFKKIFTDTISNLKEQGVRKLETRELEQKLNALNSKNYKSVISKMQNDLLLLKEENRHYNR